MVQRKKEKGGRRGKTRAGKAGGQEEGKAQALWGMLCIDDVGILQRVVTAIVTACVAFGLTVSEAKTDGGRGPAKERRCR